MFHNFMMKTCRTDANWLYLIIHAEFVWKNHVEMWIIHDHLAFEECLFVQVSVIIVFALHYMF